MQISYREKANFFFPFIVANSQLKYFQNDIAIDDDDDDDDDDNNNNYNRCMKH
jgi:hypothetical protein